MAGIKFTHMVAFMTASTLTLQMILLYTNQCHFSRNTCATEKSLRELKSPQRFYTPEHSVASVTRQRIYNATRNSPKPTITLPTIKRRLTIGIPTIQRRDGNYFSEMLHSMLNKTSDIDLKEIIFVIFLADLNNTAWKSEIEAEIKRNYTKYITSGSLQVVRAPNEFYAGMLPFGNNSYMNWRTKQNYDYAYLMRYCEHFSDYYMQMEDDVQASDGYYSAIINFIENQANDEWICLEFSELGFIGKLYRAKHLRNLSDMILIFSHTQPVDFIYTYFNILLGNGPKRIRKPTLFQHMGFHSSLADKVQPLRDKYFDFPVKEWNGDNPPAKLFTTLPVNLDFPTNLAYVREAGHFWSNGSPKENDTYSLIFDSAQSIEKIVVETGSKDHPGDIIHHGVLEVGLAVSGTAENPECEGLIILEHFQNGKIFVDSQTIQSKLGIVKIRCMQIRFIEPQEEWVIIKEIAVFLSKE